MRVYFWTVTFRELRSDWVQSKAFTEFLHELKRHIDPDIGGVKVAELHPGGHGVHFHFLCNRRVSVQVVRLWGRQFGIGRIYVEVADQNSAEYMAKYLSKRGAAPFCESGRRQRRWACFGKVPKRCRCSDLVFESPMWDYRRSKEHPRPFINWRYEHLLSRAWDFGEDTFEFAWLAARDGNMGDLMKCTVVAGYEVRRDGPMGRLVLVERLDWRGRHDLPSLDPF